MQEGECFALAASLDTHKALVHVFFASRATKKVRGVTDAGRWAGSQGLLSSYTSLSPAALAFPSAIAVTSCLFVFGCRPVRLCVVSDAHVPGRLVSGDATARLGAQINDKWPDDCAWHRALRNAVRLFPVQKKGLYGRGIQNTTSKQVNRHHNQE